MPVSYSIDRAQRRITVRIVGELDEAEIRTIERDVLSDAAYDRAYGTLVDAREACNLIGSVSILREMRAKPVVDAGVRRAFVTSNLLIYRLARLFQATHDASGLTDDVRVFRTIEEAELWFAT